VKIAPLTAAAALALAASAPVAEHQVTLPGLFVDPADVVVLVGDTVTWTNDDFRTHTVTADDGSFDSGDLAPGQRFSLTLPRQGVFAYHCSIHRFIRGVVEVYALALKGPPGPVAAGGHAVLTGLAPAGTGLVTLERLGAEGSAEPVASVPAAADGSFRFRIRPPGPAQYRAVAGELASSPVTVSVGARVTLSARPSGDGVTIVVRASPSQAGARIVLERYVRELFAWVPTRSARLDRLARATFRLMPRRQLRLRAVISHGVRGYGPATSGAVLIGPG